MSPKRGLVDPRNGRLGRELDLGDREARSLALEVHGRGRVDATRRMPGGGEPRGQRHGEAAGVSSAQQLLGIRPLAILEAVAVRVRALESPAPELQATRSFSEIAPPLSFRAACRHRLAPFSGVNSSGNRW